MQFDRLNVQSHLETLQFQQCEFVSRTGLGGIACETESAHLTEGGPAIRRRPREHPTRGAHPTQPQLIPATGANKTRPDHPVRARNVFGSGVRTLAVVRAVLTTIATLTTPLRHVILLEFVV